MNIAFQIILFLCFVPVLPILYLVMKNEAKIKKNIMVGITIPHDAREDERVIKAANTYKKQLNYLTIILLLLTLPVFFFQYSSVIIAYYLIWITAVIIILYLPYLKCHNALRALKESQGWHSPIAGKRIVDTEAAVSIDKHIHIIWFILPILITLLPFVFLSFEPKESMATEIIVYGSNLFINLLVVFVYHIIFRQKTEIIDYNTNLSIALTRMRKYHWSKFWLWMAWLTSSFTLICWLSNCNTLVILVGSVIYSTVLVIISVSIELTVRKAQQNLTVDSGKDIYVDDDDYWIKGIFYFNPNDKHLFVNARVGMNTSINLAKTTGKILMTFALISILSMPFIGIWIMAEEFTPIQIRFVDQHLEGHHIGKVFEIQLVDIESVELIEQLPSNTKIIGSAFKTLSKGTFSVSNYGRCTILLNPKIPPFIVIKDGNKTFIINGKTGDESLKLYDMIIEGL